MLVFSKAEASFFSATLLLPRFLTRAAISSDEFWVVFLCRSGCGDGEGELVLREVFRATLGVGNLGGDESIYVLPTYVVV